MLQSCKRLQQVKGIEKIMLIRFKQLSLSLLIMGVGATTFAQPVLVKSEQQIEEYRLDNGFRVILAPNAKENKVVMSTIYFTGSLNDPQGKGGMAHLLEHLAFKGTQNVPGDEFQRRLNQYTLSNNASTDYYSTKYLNTIRPDQTAINEMIYLEAERMDKLVLQEKFVPAEIAIVKREREVRMDQPYAVLMDQVWKAAYGNQYLGRLPIGDLNELQSIQMPELQRFYRNWYAPNNAVMVLTGKFDKVQVLKQIDQHFSPLAKRQIPAQVKVPVLDARTIKNRDFLVQKGSQLAKFNIYLNGQNGQHKTALALAPYLYTMQPSGHLYQGMVETGISTMVQSTTWLDQDFNLVFMGALYAPTHNAKQVETALQQGVEQGKNFNQTELNRVKTLIRNSQDSLFSNASALAGMLSDYVVSEQGNWAQYFVHQQELQALTVDQVNTRLQQFLIPEHRMRGHIQPTPEEQKKAQQQQAAEPLKTLDQMDVQAEPLKDISSYEQEIQQYLHTSKQALSQTEAKIQRGTLANGMKYALFPTSTRDDKTYATIIVDFGNEKSLFNQGEIIDLMAYLMLRASDQYSLQDIADKSIDAGGSASAQANSNGVAISIVAKKDKFDEFFRFVLEIMKKPLFEQAQFDLIKAQSLASLDRPYTEPETVAALNMARLIERYQPGDLRYHFEPEFAKQQLSQASNEKVKQLYRQFFAMDHARIAITGDYEAKPVLKLLQQQFATWNGAQPYQRLSVPYNSYAAQKQHVLSEQREFGSYQGVMTLPVGNDHPDAAALMVMSHILGDSQLTSRLAQELREKNALVYSFGSSLSLSSFENSGALSVSANYTAGKAAQLSQAVHKVFQELRKNGVTAQEVAAAKADILKQRVTALEDERRIHRMLVAQLELDRDLPYREKRDQAIARLSKADIDAVIQKYLLPQHWVEVMADQYGQPVK